MQETGGHTGEHEADRRSRPYLNKERTLGSIELSRLLGCFHVHGPHEKSENIPESAGCGALGSISAIRSSTAPRIEHLKHKLSCRARPFVRIPCHRYRIKRPVRDDRFRGIFEPLHVPRIFPS